MFTKNKFVITLLKFEILRAKQSVLLRKGAHGSFLRVLRKLISDLLGLESARKFISFFQETRASTTQCFGLPTRIWVYQRKVLLPGGNLRDATTQQ